MPKIHTSAIIDKSAEIADTVEIGPNTYIGKNVIIKNNNRILGNVCIFDNTTIDDGNEIYPFVTIGAPAQIKGYEHRAEDKVIIGKNNVIREFVSIHRGSTRGEGKTVIGNDNYIMAYCHIAHDCFIGNGVIMANNVQMGGHVCIEDYANFGGFVGIHHFTTVGRYSFVGGFSRIAHDIPPYLMVKGVPAKPKYVNVVGLRRRGFSEKVIESLKIVFKMLYIELMPKKEIKEYIAKNGVYCEEVKLLLDYVTRSEKSFSGRYREILRKV
ncbi:MAG: acyl-ACP--UDP-N-acetylglucosamine O-acyltransferase [Planctomycetota bacterium]